MKHSLNQLIVHFYDKSKSALKIYIYIILVIFLKKIEFKEEKGKKKNGVSRSERSPDPAALRQALRRLYGLKFSTRQKRSHSGESLSGGPLLTVD